jgi:hypothetical protein
MVFVHGSYSNPSGQINLSSILVLEHSIVFLEICKMINITSSAKLFLCLWVFIIIQ